MMTRIALFSLVYCSLLYIAKFRITTGKVRRLLEEDLKLEKDSLDPFKKLVSTELDAVSKYV